MTIANPELGRSLDVGGIATNLLDCGRGRPWSRSTARARA